jgi:iron complex outermembrane receptor protein
MAVDVGNTVHNGMFGYRINAVYANENPGITNTVGTRSLLAGTFDFKPFDNFTMQLDVEHIFKSQPEPGIFRFVTTPAKSVANPFPAIILPDPNTIDPTVNFAPTWAQYRAEETNVLSHNTWSISDAWQLTVDVGDSKFSRTRAFTTLQPTNFVTGDGFEQFQFSREEDENKNGRIQIAGTFDTFGLVHNALAGWQDNIRDSFAPNQTRTACAGGVYQAVTTVGATAATSTIACQTGITTVGGIQVNYKNPTFLSQMTRQTAPNLTGIVGRIEDAGFYVFDRISWGDYVDVLAGGRFGNYNDITIRPAKVKNFHAAPATTSESVVVKPFGNGDLSIYASYVEALESTGGAPSTAVNAGQTLAPAPSLQREVGIKSAFFSGLLLTADYFDIRRASTFVNGANVYVEDGKAKYSGFEVSASGEVTEELSVFVNGMVQMAKQISGAPSCGAAPFPITQSCQTFSPSLVGNNVSNTAKAYGSAFVQYKLYDFVEGLALNGGIHYVGGRPLDATNQAVLPAYFTIDLGASYTTDRFDYPVTFRINAQNVTGKRYYASGDADLFAVGQPSTVNFSLETHL